MRLSLILLLFVQFCHAQIYSDYLGGGHNNGVSITTSSGTAGQKTFDGDGLVAKQMDAARFLSQASFGGDMTDINSVMNMGFDAWINDQKTKPVSDYHMEVEDIWDIVYNGYLNAGYQPDDIFGPYHPHFNYAWFEHLMTKDDQMRQRISYALSQIMVVSVNSDLTDWAYALGSYYNVLQDHAFGNYKDLLLEVTLHPAMGYYLSHYNNPKSNPAANIHPDENYAREIMQLFTIGLYEMNIDGSYKMSGGNRIPTYNNAHIKEFAKVFTGLGPGGLQPWVDWTNNPYFGLDMYSADRTVPMIMYESWHEQGSKTLLAGQAYSSTIPAGQTGMEDIEDAVDFLFNHPNVGPFVARRMIQRLIKSNPSPDYIEAVALAFNNNGQGVRGDMTAMLKAILLHPEARSCGGIESADAGRLREPLLRFTNLIKCFPTIAPNNNYWNTARDLEEDMGQRPLAAPSVFNFYTPDYQPIGPLLDQGLVAPEFQIFNSHTAAGYINKIHSSTFWDFLMYDWEEDDIFGNNAISFQSTYLENQIDNRGEEEFLNDLDILLSYGQMTDDTRAQLRNAAQTLNWGSWNDAMVMVYLLMISPDFAILK